MGFDWPTVQGVLAKIDEELAEIQDAIETPAATQADIAEEFGDFLFAAANLARHLNVDPEEALRRANLKFQRRFKAMETDLKARGQTVEGSDLAMLEQAWAAVKAREPAA